MVIKASLESELKHAVFELKTTRVRFTCGPRVSKTGAAGAFINKINMTNNHGKSNAFTSNDNGHSSNKSDKVIENEAKIV